MKKFIMVIIMLVLSSICIFGCSTDVDNSKISSEDQVIELEPIETIAVITQIDLDNGQISFIDVDSEEEYILAYNGGVDVADKYGNILSANQLKLGQIVNLGYKVADNKLTYIHLNADAWELTKIDKVNINVVDKVLKYEGGDCKFDDGLVAFSDGSKIALSEICSEDQVTLRGYKGKLCSINVDYGHGYVVLKDYDTYIDGMLEIGYDVIVPVTDSMLVTVREGDYKLKITKGSDGGYKNITVEKNKQIEVSLKELQIEPASQGTILFQVEPLNASVYIDGELIDQAVEYESIYGLHRIKLVADGYTTYSGYFKISEPYRIRKYTMVSEATDSTETSTESTTTEESDTVSDAVTTTNKITITSPIGVNLYVDGNYIGVTPTSFTKTVGSHTLTLSQTGYVTKSYTISLINNGKDEEFTYSNLAATTAATTTATTTATTATATTATTTATTTTATTK